MSLGEVPVGAKSNPNTPSFDFRRCTIEARSGSPTNSGAPKVTLQVSSPPSPACSENDIDCVTSNKFDTMVRAATLGSLKHGAEQSKVDKEPKINHFLPYGYVMGMSIIWGLVKKKNKNVVSEGNG
jgi:hypothetical protein